MTGKLRTRPHSIVLLDEIEKAHPEVFDLFLQIFDDGRVTDSKGRTVTARHAIFIMTTNLATDAGPERRMGFEPHVKPSELDRTPVEVQGFFRPEFIGRIDEQVIFRALEIPQLREIVARHVEALAERLRVAHQIELDVDQDVITALARKGHDPRRGARHVRQVVEHKLEEPLAQHILKGTIRGPRRVCVRLAGNDLQFEQRE